MDGFRPARQITKKFARTFYFASLFLEKNRRLASYAVYAACRISDESVDSPDTGAELRLAELKQKIDSAYGERVLDDAVLSALRATVKKYRIPREYFEELLAGMRMDLVKNRYADFDQLYDYCYKVAGVVGLIMLRIFGWQEEAAGHAVQMGVAMQLTNILRDIKEDFQRGRIYLPLDEMGRFGVSEKDIAAGSITGDFRGLMRFQIARARDYYSRASAGIALIHDANSRFVARAMSDIYAGILGDIEKNNYDVFSRRARVNLAGKICTILKYCRDRTVFCPYIR